MALNETVGAGSGGDRDVMTQPVTVVPDVSQFVPQTGIEQSRYTHVLPGGLPLDALLVDRQSDVLVVSFHGALNRQTNTLPRFERLKTLLEYDVSSLYFTDPALHLADHLELAWFTGPRDLDVHEVIARWTARAAEAIGASHIIFSGSSGGGFAALQAATFVPGSLALPFNPQTSIYGYLANGTSRGAQRVYAEAVMPHLAPDGFAQLDEAVDWTEPLGERASVLRRYARPVDNRVLYAENPNEFHYRDHYLPFLAAAARGGNLDRIRVHEYLGDERHNPPNPVQFRAALDEALAWVRE